MERFIYVTSFEQYLSMFRVSWLLKKKSLFAIIVDGVYSPYLVKPLLYIPLATRGKHCVGNSQHQKARQRT